MHHHSHAAGYGLPESNETGQRANAPGPHATTHTPDSDARIASLQERLKAHGFDLQRQPSGALLICKWGYAREFDLAGAESFARKVGAA